MSDTEITSVSFTVKRRRDRRDAQVALFLGESTWVEFAPLGSGRVVARLVKCLPATPDPAVPGWLSPTPPLVLLERELRVPEDLATEAALLLNLAHGGVA